MFKKRIFGRKYKNGKKKWENCIKNGVKSVYVRCETKKKTEGGVGGPGGEEIEINYM